MSTSGTEDWSHPEEKIDTSRDFSDFMRLSNALDSPQSMKVFPDSAEEELITGRFSTPCHQLVMMETAYTPLQ